MNLTKTLTQTLTGIIPLIGLLGCSNPADNVPAASVNKSSNAPATAAKAAKAPDAGDRYFVLGPESSAITFVGSKVTGKHDGGFQKFTGEFKVEQGRVADAGNKIVIDASSLFADNDRLTGHLKSRDFFNVAQFPTATFVTTAVDQSKDPATVTGDLTLHGVTKSISFPAKIEVANDGVTVTSEFVLNRFDFEIKYAGMANDLVRKEVVLKLNVKAAPGRADFASVEQAAQAGAAAAAAAPQMQRPRGGARPGGGQPGGGQRQPPGR